MVTGIALDLVTFTIDTCIYAARHQISAPDLKDPLAKRGHDMQEHTLQEAAEAELHSQQANHASNPQGELTALSLLQRYQNHHTAQQQVSTPQVCWAPHPFLALWLLKPAVQCANYTTPLWACADNTDTVQGRSLREQERSPPRSQCIMMQQQCYTQACSYIEHCISYIKNIAISLFYTTLARVTRVTLRERILCVFCVLW